MTFNEDIGRVLGQKVSYSAQYDPSILVREPRKRNRDKYDIDEANLPFKGFDNWNCYEVSFLLDNGYPLSGIGRLVYPCHNPYLVESKSLKLYLNSFNMSRWGKTEAEAIQKVTDTIKKDLSTLLEVPVDFQLFFQKGNEWNPWVSFKPITDFFYAEELDITRFDEAPDVLEGRHCPDQIFFNNVSVPFLRSNCKITHQPDWGTAYIHIGSDHIIDMASLAKYLISFRNENHFHEEVCEMIFQRLMQKFKPVQLFVGCCYTRRGGIDICPMRATHLSLIPPAFTRATEYYPKLLQQ